jgi:hypothetical protein
MLNTAKKAAVTVMLTLSYGLCLANEGVVVDSPVTASVTPVANADAVIKEGTIISVELLDVLSSKMSKTGDIFRMKTKQDLVIDGKIIIPAGSMAYGTVTYAEKRRMMGQPGELYYRMDYLKVGDSQIKIRSSRSAEGKDATGSTIALVALFGVFGTLKKGKDIEVPVGTSFEVYIAETSQIAL